MRRLGEAASDVPGGWYSPKSTPSRKGGERGRSHPREKLNAGLILLAIQPLILSPLHSFSRFALSLSLSPSPSYSLSPFVPYGQTNALFPVGPANRGIGSNGYSAPRVCLFPSSRSSPSLTLSFISSAAVASFLSAAFPLRVLFLLLAPLS